MTEEEKARLDLLTNCIIEDSERVTLPGDDSEITALKAEVTRLTIKCERYRHALCKVVIRCEELETTIDDVNTEWDNLRRSYP